MKKCIALALVIVSAPAWSESFINPEVYSKEATCEMLNSLPGDTDPAQGIQLKFHANTARNAGMSQQGVLSFANAFDIRLTGLCRSNAFGEEFISAMRAAWQETCTQAFPGLTQRVMGTQRAILGSDLYKCRRADDDYVGIANMFHEGFRKAQAQEIANRRRLFQPLGFGPYGPYGQQLYGIQPFFGQQQGGQADCGPGVNNSEVPRSSPATNVSPADINNSGASQGYEKRGAM